MNDIFEIKNAFAPVGGLSPTQTMKMMKVEAAFRECAEQVLDLVPEGSDRTYIMRQLLQAKFWASQAISHEGVSPKKSEEKPNTPAGKQKTPGPLSTSPSSESETSEASGPKNG